MVLAGSDAYNTAKTWDARNVSPARHRAVGSECEAEINVAGNRHHLGKTAGNGSLPGIVYSPANNGAVAEQRQRIIACRDDSTRIQTGWNITLTKCIRTPGYHRAVKFQRQAVRSACGNGHHVLQAGRHMALTVFIGTPCDYGSVRLERQAEPRTGGDGVHIVQSARHIALTVEVEPPGNHSPGTRKCQGVVGGRGQPRDVVQSGRRVGLAAAPNGNRPAARQIGPEQAADAESEKGLVRKQRKMSFHSVTDGLIRRCSRTHNQVKPCRVLIRDFFSTHPMAEPARLLTLTGMNTKKSLAGILAALLLSTLAGYAQQTPYLYRITLKGT